MRTVSVVVPWRGKLPWTVFFQTGVAACPSPKPHT